MRSVLDRSPEVALARLGLERADAVAARERRANIPDLDLEVGVLDDRQPISAGGPPLGAEAFAEARIALPLFDRNRGEIAAADAERESSLLEIERLGLELEARFVEAFARYANAVDAARAYREEILPAAQESYRLYLSSYRQMTAAYPQVLIAQRSLFEAEADAVTALLAAWSAVAALDGALVASESGGEGAGSALHRGSSMP
ncbi:MAG TPA: TolC family protein [Thermoanaerobaculia bacterium]|nr:TolC family protein [Thermoanaerobaculia bacterium]